MRVRHCVYLEWIATMGAPARFDARFPVGVGRRRTARRHMLIWMARVVGLFLLMVSAVSCQRTEPFPSPIVAAEGMITVGIAEFASLPDVDGEAARTMHLVDEPGTRRLFVSDMRGLLYGISYDGRTVTPYLDLTAETWGLSVEARGSERGFQSFAFHPEFARPGTPGFGKFYTYFDTSNTVPTPDFVPGGDDRAQDTLLVEWTAETPSAATYDGGPPRVLMRIEQPFGNHNGGQIGFNPLVSPGDADGGLLYIGSADGGSGGDPLDLAQNTGSVFGKILRIDPLGSNSTNGQYGIPPVINLREVSLADPRSASGLTYPVAEYAHANPLLQSRSAVTGVVVYRETAIPQLANLVLFGDNPSGEVFYIQADQLSRGGQSAIRRVLFNDGGEPKTLLQLVQAKNREQGKTPAQRADLRFGMGPDTQIFVINKHDGTIRVLVP